ncbi:MAG: transglutaminase domain-containing protein [Gammaproteobacteria bacterium]
MSLDALPQFALDPSAFLARLFIQHGLRDFRAAAQHVWHLAYGRTSVASDYRRVLAERRGTCSTKHALLAALAREHRQPVQLVLGIYEMSDANTPGTGAVLKRAELASLPEAHCYLLHDGVRVDLARAAPSSEPITRFLWEESIAPEQIGDYKRERHRQFLSVWAAERRLEFEAVWQARERCIAALAGEIG